MAAARDRLEEPGMALFGTSHERHTWELWKVQSRQGAMGCEHSQMRATNKAI